MRMTACQKYQKGQKRQRDLQDQEQSETGHALAWGRGTGVAQQ